jgi:hypothetical protein
LIFFDFSGRNIEIFYNEKSRFLPKNISALKISKRISFELVFDGDSESDSFIIEKLSSNRENQESLVSSPAFYLIL